MFRIRWTRTIVWTAAALLAAGLLAPVLVTLNFWHARIDRALSSSLGHRVETKAIHLKLFGGLGFEINNVRIAEDPRFGVEPVARMETLQATLALRSLWKRRLEFSSLVFVRPSLNVVRNAEGKFNVESLWRVAAAGGTRSGPSAPLSGSGEPFERLPQIQIEQARINFKSDNSKKVYLVDNLDLQVTPPGSATEPWRLRFEGRPNRTDFPLNPDGRVRGEAAFGPFTTALRSEAGSLAHVDLAADNAFVGDVLRILTGNDHGLHGTVNLNLHLAGTTSLLRLSGTADLRDLHRWDRLPPMGGSVLHSDISALVDLEKESIELRSLTIPLTQGYVRVEGSIDQLLRGPRADLQAELRTVELNSIVEIAKQFVTRIDPGVTAAGVLNGRLRMEGGPGAVHGRVTVTGGRLEQKGLEQEARISSFDIDFDGDIVEASPFSMTLGEGGKLAVGLKWNNTKKELAARLEGEDVRLASLLPWTRALGTRWGRADFSGGNVDFRLSATAGEGQAAWVGWAQISDGVLNAASVNQPIRVPAARLEFKPGTVKVKPFSARLGEIDLSGNFLAHLIPNGPIAESRAIEPPLIEFDLHASEIDLAELDRLLDPRNRSGSFLGINWGGARAPNFFTGIAAKGTLDTAAFSYHRMAIGNFKAALEFRDRTLEVKTFSGEFAGGSQYGKATVRFGMGAPEFELESRFTNLDTSQLTRDSAAWSGIFAGKLSGVLRLAGEGWNAAEIRDHLGGSGEATGANASLFGFDLVRGLSKPDLATRLASVSASFQIARKEIVLTDMKMVPAAPGARMARGEPRQSLQVTGTVGFDRALDVVVAEKAGGQRFHWGGSIQEPQVAETTVSLRSGSEAHARYAH